MDSMALAHNFESYYQAEQQQQQQRQLEEQLELVNQARIEFSETMVKVAKFGFFMSLSGGAVFMFRLLPILSFGGFLVRALTLVVLLKESIFATDEDDRRDFQTLLTSVSLGSIGAEWDSILAIGTAAKDFLTLYSGSIIGFLILAGALALWLLFRGGNNAQPATLATSNNYTSLAEMGGYDNE